MKPDELISQEELDRQFGLFGQEEHEEQEEVEVHPAEFTPLVAEAPKNGGSSIDLLLDVMLQVTVELGRSSMMIKDILALGPGSVIELDKLAGEPVDIMINSTLIARGEVVVVDEKFGVRVTEVVSPARRIASMAP